MDVPIFTFSPVTSVNVERSFSDSKSLVEDRPHILEETINHMIFIRYNTNL